MRALTMLAVLALLCAAAPARADELPSALSAPEREAIQGVISAQMRAFAADNGPAAFAFAAPGIQAQFGDAANFLAMVRRGYQPVYRPRSVAFGPLVVLDGQTVQKVELIGPDGAGTTALYFMEHEADGAWRIKGCVLTASQSLGA